MIRLLEKPTPTSRRSQMVSIDEENTFEDIVSLEKRPVKPGEAVRRPFLLVSHGRSAAYLRLAKRIRSFGSPESLPEGIEVPANYQALQTAQKVLEVFQRQGFLPSAVNPSPEGGVMFEHVIQEHYYMIEIYNDGGIVYLHRLPNERLSDEELQLEQIFERIQQDIKPLH